MKLITIPDGLIEGALMLGNRLPTPIAETFGAMMLARSIEAANNVGIFEQLAYGPQSLEQLCAHKRLNVKLCEALLQALEACGYVEQVGNQYQNTRLTKRFLEPSSPQYVGNFIRYNSEQRLIWAALESMLTSEHPMGLQQALQGLAQTLQARFPEGAGEERNFHHVLKDETTWKNYMLGLRDLANISIQELEHFVRIPQALSQLLDIGGGHGAYSAWMCGRYKRLNSTILELEGAAQVGKRLIADQGLSHRIRYQVGDLMEAELPSRHYDAIFAFNILHHLSVEQNQTLLRRIKNALKPGGKVWIWDEFRDDSLKKSEIARMVGVMFLLASGGDTWSFAQVQEWLRAAGLQGGKPYTMKSAPGTALIQAVHRAD